MFGNRYGKALTIILIIVIIAIVVGLCFLGYGVYKKYKGDKDTKLAIAEFNSEIIDQPDGNNTDDGDETINKIEYTGEDTSGENTSGVTLKKKVFYEDLVMLGTIDISSIKLSLPILEVETPKALDTGACLRYKTNEELNQPGNVVLSGHNYRNGKLFSNLEKLAVGDKISIKDTSGNRVSYTIYKIFETSIEDTSFYNRDTEGNVEITLSTCTDDGSARLIVLAKVN